MQLGAQLYSLRNVCNSPEMLRSTLIKLRKIGYTVAQASAICEIEPEILKSFIDESGIAITSTHRPFDEIVERTSYCIEFHKIIGCETIGLGGMPGYLRESYETIKEFKKIMEEPIKRINEAGLHFAYHNHDFEFEKRGGVKVYDFLIEEMPEMHFIHDVYWTTYAGEDPKRYIRELTADGRIIDIHFKDMKTAPQGPICPCGDGVIYFSELSVLCRECGIKNVQVEQDNAPQLGDVFEQMERSYNHLHSMVCGD